MTYLAICQLDENVIFTTVTCLILVSFVFFFSCIPVCQPLSISARLMFGLDEYQIGHDVAFMRMGCSLVQQSCLSTDDLQSSGISILWILECQSRDSKHEKS